MARSWAIWGANSLSRSHGLTPIPPMPLVGCQPGFLAAGSSAPGRRRCFCWPLGFGGLRFELKRTEVVARVRHNEDVNMILRVRLQ